MTDRDRRRARISPVSRWYGISAQGQGKRVARHDSLLDASLSRVCVTSLDESSTARIRGLPSGGGYLIIPPSIQDGWALDQCRVCNPSTPLTRLQGCNLGELVELSLTFTMVIQIRSTWTRRPARATKRHARPQTTAPRWQIGCQHSDSRSAGLIGRWAAPGM